MLNLKAELLKTKQEFDGLKSKSEKSYVTAKKTTDGSSSWLKKNRGIEKRNQKDLEYKDGEENKEDKVRTILEAKSKMYDKMVSGEMMLNEEDSEMFLVDFEQKSINTCRDKLQCDQDDQSDKHKVKLSQPETKLNDEWVEYVDSLERNRTCLKSEIHRYQKMDAKLDDYNNTQQNTGGRSLMSDDMRREEERARWEEEAREELEKGPLHYENLRHGEVRELGVGYYSFSSEEDRRKEQMKKLNALRKETEKQQDFNKRKKEKQNSALQSRLEKVRQKRIKQLTAQGKEIPAKLLEPLHVEVETTEEPKEETPLTTTSTSSVVEVTSLKTTSTTRDWDRGKDDWTPASAPKLPTSWTNPRENRPSEFAPPSFYDAPERVKKRRIEPTTSNTHQSETVLPSNNELEVKHSDADRIQRVLETLNSAPDKNDAVPDEINSEILEEVKPFVPQDKPITMTVKQKPRKILSTKSAFNE